MRAASRLRLRAACAGLVLGIPSSSSWLYADAPFINSMTPRWMIEIMSESVILAVISSPGSSQEKLICGVPGHDAIGELSRLSRSSFELDSSWNESSEVWLNSPKIDISIFHVFFKDQFLLIQLISHPSVVEDSPNYW